jgi:hypothetical protein
MHPEYILIIILNIILVIFFSIRNKVFSNNVLNYQESNVVKQSSYDFNTILLFLLVLFFFDLGIVFLFPLCFSFNIYHAGGYSFKDLNSIADNFENLSHTEISSRMAIDLKVFNLSTENINIQDININDIDFNSNIIGNLFNHTAVPLPTEPEPLPLPKGPEKAGFWTRISYNMQYYFLTSSNWLNSYISIFPRFDHNNSFVFKYFRNFETYSEELKLFNLKTENYQMKLIRIQEINEFNFKESLNTFQEKLMIPESRLYPAFILHSFNPETELEVDTDTLRTTYYNFKHNRFPQTFLRDFLQDFLHVISCDVPREFNDGDPKHIVDFAKTMLRVENHSIKQCIKHYPLHHNYLKYVTLDYMHREDMERIFTAENFGPSLQEVNNLIKCARRVFFEKIIENSINVNANRSMRENILVYSPLYYEYIKIIRMIYDETI